MFNGGCYCGAVRYEVDGPVSSSTLCHCASCRRIAGAPCVAWFTVALAHFRYVRGAPQRFHSSPGVTRSFCPQCGAHLSYESVGGPGETDITTASLDEPEALPPQDHTQVADQLNWLQLADHLPRYPHSRSEGATPSPTAPD